MSVKSSGTAMRVDKQSKNGSPSVAVLHRGQGGPWPPPPPQNSLTGYHEVHAVFKAPYTVILNPEYSYTYLHSSYLKGGYLF